VTVAQVDEESREFKRLVAGGMTRLEAALCISGDRSKAMQAELDALRTRPEYEFCWYALPSDQGEWWNFMRALGTAGWSIGGITTLRPGGHPVVFFQRIK
jgi:hypothetical protein